MSSSSDVVYVLDARGERHVAVLRLCGAAVCLVGSGVIAALGPPPVGWVVVLLGALAGTGWAVAGVRGLRRARSGGAAFLALRADALEIADGAVAVRVPWGELLGAEVDEEKLVVVVRRRDDAPLLVEPRYAGLSVYDLARVIRERTAGG